MMSAADDRAACRALMRGGSRTFSAAALLLPRRVHEPATALYAFCRLADDAIDESSAEQGGALLRLQDRLDRAYAGRPLPIAADRAFAAAVAEHAVPRALPAALLEGFAWDSAGRRYEDLEALQDYAARVAGSVGAMMAVLMGVRDRQALARACDLGVAMQLTNIARDVGEDARAGRLYLPLTWLDDAGIDPASWLADPVFNPAIGGVVQRLLAAADALYARAAGGVAHLPASCRPGIRAAGLIYQDIGRVIAAAGYDSVSARAHVRDARKAMLLARSVGAWQPRRAAPALPVLPAVQFLVDSAAGDARAARRFAPAQAVGSRMVWVFDLFKRLEHGGLEQAGLEAP